MDAEKMIVAAELAAGQGPQPAPEPAASGDRQPEREPAARGDRQPEPELELSRSLHRLTARLDHAADALLRSDAGISYARFLALYMVGLEGADTQRALAERLGISEPSVSRMVRVLQASGLLEKTAQPGGGNRHRLRLTATGEQLVTRSGGDLERRFARLVQSAGVPYATYLQFTQQLLLQLGPAPRDGTA